MAEYEPLYIGLHRRGLLRERAAQALKLICPCRMCPRRCHADRIAGELGDCRTGRFAQVASLGPHFGEESPLVGWNGSGTIFFAGCNLNCDFCQNWDISQEGRGQEVDAERLAGMFLHIQKLGCHNLNLVTPTHVTAQVLEALVIAADNGFELPIVYNCGGYESVDTLRLLDGVVDIYMPDLKFTDTDPARRFCHAPDYPEVARAAIAEMHRQVGDLQMDEHGLARRGLLVRHLVMPDGLAGTEEAARFLASLSPNTYVNVMAQYRPCHEADRHPELTRRITAGEYNEAVEAMRRAGLHRLDGEHRAAAWK
ncbi:MAG: radical SAM protein [Deltaproteobacteria bacterium]|nr:MAG: radical SAM protein [Deltaproteobacteria bacterium]